jgi:hypothetical protein
MGLSGHIGLSGDVGQHRDAAGADASQGPARGDPWAHRPRARRAEGGGEGAAAVAGEGDTPCDSRSAYTLPSVLAM